jgi:hypothetical protein
MASAAKSSPASVADPDSATHSTLWRGEGRFARGKSDRAEAKKRKALRFCGRALLNFLCDWILLYCSIVTFWVTGRCPIVSYIRAK